MCKASLAAQKEGHRRLGNRTWLGQGLVLSALLSLGWTSALSQVQPATSEAAALALQLDAPVSAGGKDLPDLPDLPELSESPETSADAPPSSSAPAAGGNGGAFGSRAYVEVGRGEAALRGGGQRMLSRVTLDGRWVQRIAPGWAGTLSARVDSTRPEDARLGEAVLTLREAAVAWQDADRRWTLQAGRVNLREGPAYGYNPTDFLKPRALRTVTTANPASLRESRLGTAMVRAEQLGPDSSWSVALAPSLADGLSRQGRSLDLGATNDRTRLLLTQGQRWSPRLDTRALLYWDEHTAPQVGVSGSALLGEATVAHLEWVGGRGLSLRDQALGGPPATTPNRWHQRWTAGATHTTANGLSLTVEWQHNGAALGRAGWQALRLVAPEALGAYFAEAAALQDNASRDALFVYINQRDALWRGLDLSALIKHSRDDRSQFAWVELRQRLERMDVFAQWQQARGETGSEFGSLPFRHSWALYVSIYF